MKLVTNSKELLKEIKKSKKGDTIVFDERANPRNEFKVSGGNLEVLKKIPEMMMDEKWRKALRLLVLDFISDDVLKRGGKR